jgi:hypothetical protein
VSRRQVAEPAFSMSCSRDARFLMLVVLIGAVLLFCRLDDAYLWQDEAETALVGRHLLAYGLPLSSDGRDWVQQSGEPFVEFTSDYVWIYHSWLQYALVAASFALFGPTTLAARLPFAVAGLVVLVLSYRLVLHGLGDRRVARMATVLLLFCVPFLLLMRQCRYYALTTVAALLTLDAYLWLRSARRWALPLFVLLASLLYHCHYGAFFPTLAALGVHWLLSSTKDRTSHRYWQALVLLVVLVLPWAVFMRVAGRGQPFRADRFLAHMGQYFVYTTGWLFPLALLTLLVIAWKRSARHRFLALTRSQADYCWLVALIVLGNLLVLSVSAAFDWVYFRYMVHLIPLLLSVLAVLLVQINEQKARLAGVLLALTVVTNALSVVPYGLPGLRDWSVANLWPESAAFLSLQKVWNGAGRFRSDAWMYLQELTGSYEGPNEGLVAYLEQHAQPEDSLAVNYEDLPLMFYTDLQVVGGLGVHDLDADSRPDWIVDRQHGPYRDLLAEMLASGSYERIVLPYPDIRWENRPGPTEHHYQTVEDADPVVLYRRVGM